MLSEDERDNLLIRLDERSRNTWQLVEKLEQHQAAQNGKLEEAVRSIYRNTIGRRVLTTTAAIAAGAWLSYIAFLFLL